MTQEVIHLPMTVTNGINSETITMPATLHQTYETVITPPKDNHGQETIKNPTADGHVNRSFTPATEVCVNSDLGLPAIPNIDYKTEAAIPPVASIQHDGEPTVPLVHSHELKRDSISFLVLNEAINSTQVSIQNEGEPLSLPVRTKEYIGDLTSSLAPSKGHVDEDLLPPCTRLQRFLKETDDILVCPGVYDGFSARIALSVGFKAMYMVGWASIHVVHPSKYLLMSS